MAYVIAEPCIGTKDNSCVEVCPVDCIHPTPDEPEDMDGIAELLDEAEDVVNAAAPEILDEFEPPKARRRWWPFGRRG